MEAARRQTYIVNPLAAQRGRYRSRSLVARLRRAAPLAEILVSAGPGDARRLAAERRDGPDRVVVAVGGDGTVHEVGSGLVGGSASFGVLPAGSGNDFASMIRVPETLEQAPEFFANISIRVCDVGAICTIDEDGEVREDMVLNSVGLGFEGRVAARAQRLGRVPGRLRYLLAVLLELPGFRPPAMQIRMDDDEIQAPQFLIAVGNGCRSGGGFVLNPQAQIDDGWLDVCRADALPLYRLLRILPSVFHGEHGDYDGIHQSRCRRFELAIDTPQAVHVDGEILSLNACQVSLKLLPDALRLAG